MWYCGVYVSGDPLRVACLVPGPGREQICQVCSDSLQRPVYHKAEQTQCIHQLVNCNREALATPDPSRISGEQAETKKRKRVTDRKRKPVKAPGAFPCLDRNCDMIFFKTPGGANRHMSSAHSGANLTLYAAKTKKSKTNTALSMVSDNDSSSADASEMSDDDIFGSNIEMKDDSTPPDRLDSDAIESLTNIKDNDFVVVDYDGQANYIGRVEDISPDPAENPLCKVGQICVHYYNTKERSKRYAPVYTEPDDEQNPDGEIFSWAPPKAGWVPKTCFFYPSDVIETGFTLSKSSPVPPPHILKLLNRK